MPFLGKHSGVSESWLSDSKSFGETPKWVAPSRRRRYLPELGPDIPSISLIFKVALCLREKFMCSTLCPVSPFEATTNPDPMLRASSLKTSNMTEQVLKSFL